MIKEIFTEILDFICWEYEIMEKINFEQLSSKYNEKNIIKLCQKCSKSCSLKKSKDVANLCELAYWLYVYDYKDEVVNIYNLVDIDIPKKVNYNIWTWILSIWGLQAYIYELDGVTQKKDNIIENMKKVHSVPRSDEQSEKEAWAFYEKIAKRQTYEDICNEKKIERTILDKDKKLEVSYRFTALYKMISYGVTGFYPDLENNKEKLREKINYYIEILKCNG